MVSSLSQTILVFGLGKTGLSLCHYLSAKNHTVFAIDEKSKHEFSIDISNVPAKNFFFGNPFDYLLQLPKDLDLILISPGIDKQHPFLKKVKECYPNITIAGEIEFLHRLITIPWIAVTGTDGKSTVSDLLRHIFERSHYRVFLGGNFGTPLAELIPHQKDYDIAVIELSSFQLEDTTELDPDVSIITNVAPDHLYRHHSFDEYVRCKANIFISQSQKHTAVLDYDEHLIAFRKQTNANLRWVSLKERPNEQNFIGCYYSHYEKKYYHIFTSANYETSHSFVINNEKLVGKFQPQNFMAAFEASRHFQLSEKEIIESIQSYNGLAHRIEFVRDISGICFYNDSKATNIHAMTSAIVSFEAPLYVIAGGKDKGESLDPLIEAGKGKIDTIYFIGECSEKFEKILSKHYHCVLCHNLENAVNMAFQNAISPSVILFSPGAASFDQYQNFTERGNHFKKLVLAL